MSQPSLPADDQPNAWTLGDRVLRLKLEQRAGKHFYKSCDRISQALLDQCGWRLASEANATTLVVSCPTIEIYWHIVAALPQIGRRLQQFAGDRARLCIRPPLNKGEPLELSVRELPADL